jgi:elongation factor 1 alpha-like protein
MSNRHRTFENNLKYGRYSEKYSALDDDYDHDEDEDYDPEEEVFVKHEPVKVAPPAKQGKKVPGATAAPAGVPAKKSATPAQGSQAPAGKKPSAPANTSAALDDEEVLDPVFRQIRPIVPSEVSDEEVRAEIRKANYDADNAVMALFAVAEAKPKAPPATTSATTSPPAASAPAEKQQQPRTRSPGKTEAVSVPVHDHSRILTIGRQSTEEESVAKGNQPPSSTSDSAAETVGMTRMKSDGEASVKSQQSGRTESKASVSSSVAPALDPNAKKKVALQDDDGKSMLHLVLSGHVDSGKSTILGHLLVLVGEVDERVVTKFEAQAKAIGKATFQYAWVLDSSEEERRRGVTIDGSQQTFSTPTKHIVVMDAPGHKQFVVNMISSATQADVALLVVTVARGEFEAGLSVGTLEHLMILRTLGITQIIVAMNKMDSVEWSEARYQECVLALKSVLRQTRFKDEDVLGFCPLSGLTGQNLTPEKRIQLPWYKGPTLLELIDAVPPVERLANYPLRATVSDAFKSTVCCQIEAGSLKAGDAVVFVPAGLKATVKGVEKVGFGTVKEARVGDAVEISINVEATGVYAGNIVCPAKNPCRAALTFEAHIQTFGTLQRSLIPGTQLMMSLHMLTVPVIVETLISVMDKKGAWSQGFVKCVRKEQQAMVLFRVDQSVAMELADDVRSLGRFVLRLDGEIAGGGFVKRVVTTAEPPK